MPSQSLRSISSLQRSMPESGCGRMTPNQQLERTVIRHRVRAASAAAPLCARDAHDTSTRGRSTARYTAKFDHRGVCRERTGLIAGTVNGYR